MSSIAFICCLVALPAVLAQANIPTNVAECISKTGATIQDLQKFHSFEIPTTQAGSCLIACVTKALGLVNADNSLNLDNVMGFINDIKQNAPPGVPADIGTKIETMFKTCKAKEKVIADECAAAKNMAECLSEQKAVVGLPNVPMLPLQRGK